VSWLFHDRGSDEAPEHFFSLEELEAGVAVDDEATVLVVS